MPIHLQTQNVLFGIHSKPQSDQLPADFKPGTVHRGLMRDGKWITEEELAQEEALAENGTVPKTPLGDLARFAGKVIGHVLDHVTRK